jgi:hypothetical protein
VHGRYDRVCHLFCHGPLLVNPSEP